MSELKEIISMFGSASWAAVAGLGAYLGYKLALTTIISVAVLKAIGKVIDMIRGMSEPVQQMNKIINAAGYAYPLTEEELKELTTRLRGSKS